MDSFCHIPDLVQVFPYVEKGWFDDQLNISLDSQIKLHYIANEVSTKQTDIIDKNVKNTAVNLVLLS